MFGNWPCGWSARSSAALRLLVPSKRSSSGRPMPRSVVLRSSCAYRHTARLSWTSPWARRLGSLAVCAAHARSAQILCIWELLRGGRLLLGPHSRAGTHSICCVVALRARNDPRVHFSALERRPRLCTWPHLGRMLGYYDRQLHQGRVSVRSLGCATYARMVCYPDSHV